MTKKQKKNFLEGEKELIYAQWAAELQKEAPNMALVAYWNNSIVTVEEMIKRLDNATEA